MNIFLWEILVPAESGGKEIPVEFHWEWDKKIRELTGGLSIMKPMKGHWVSDSNDIFAEKIIPVRIACTQVQIYDIAKMTQEYYNQDAIMLYKVSDMVLFFERGMTSLESYPSF